MKFGHRFAYGVPGKDSVQKMFLYSLLGLPVFFLLGVGGIETSGTLRVGDLSYQWLWLSRLGFLLFVCASLGVILALCKKRNTLPGFHTIVTWSLIIWGGVESVRGLCQIYGFASSNHTLYKLTGSFFNPGPYSGYLAMVFPLCLNEWLRLRKKRERNYIEYAGYYLSVGVVLLIVCLLPAGMSRSAWIAAIVSGIWVYGMHYSWKAKLKLIWRKHRKRVIGIVVLVFAGLVIGGVSLFSFKKDSANGRLLMWKISTMAILQSPMGYGTGMFAYAYGNAQETYFAKGDYSMQEELVAGSPDYAFNEYLQVAVEWGIVTLLCVLVGIGFCLWWGMKKNRIGICGGIIALLVFAFSSYPMHIPTFVISFTLLLAACVTGRSRIGLFVLSLCIGGMSYYIRQNNVYEACREWANVKTLYNMGAYETAKERYERLYASLKKQGSFLFEYGYTLHKLKEYDASIGILKEAEVYNCDPMILNIIGKNYQQKEEYEEAEKYYWRSVHRIPGRIYPYYLLAKMYDEWGRIEKMQEMAEIVLTKEPKVESTAVEEMRKEIKILLNKSGFSGSASKME